MKRKELQIRVNVMFFHKEQLFDAVESYSSVKSHFRCSQTEEWRRI